MTVATASGRMAPARSSRSPLAGDRNLLPRVQSPLRTLTVAMTVMCYLACLAIGGMVLIHQAVNAWTSDIASEVTVQITPVEDEDIEANVASAVKIIKATKGVTGVNVLDKAAGEKLLEPAVAALADGDEQGGALLGDREGLGAAVVGVGAALDQAELDEGAHLAAHGGDIDVHGVGRADTRIGSRLRL